MSSRFRAALVLVGLTALGGTAAAQDAAPEDETPPPAGMPAVTPPTDAGPGEAPPPPDEKKKPKEPKAGDFDAGGQVRLPNGPDGSGTYKSFNWIALDLKGKYYILKQISVTGTFPLAVKKPDMLLDGSDPRLIGGANFTFEARLPKFKVPMAPKANDTDVGVTLSGAYMREGAMLLSEKDYPLFVGGFKPGFTTGLTVKTSLSSLLDFSLLPVFVYQSGSMESLTAVQIPTSIIVKLGSLLKVSADVGVYTGDNFTFRGSKGGRVALGAAVDVKIGPIITHLGAGAASLTTGGVYPTIKDSVYFDLNVKYAR